MVFLHDSPTIKAVEPPVGFMIFGVFVSVYVSVLTHPAVYLCRIRFPAYFIFVYFVVTGVDYVDSNLSFITKITHVFIHRSVIISGFIFLGVSGLTV